MFTPFEIIINVNQIYIIFKINRLNEKSIFAIFFHVREFEKPLVRDWSLMEKDKQIKIKWVIAKCRLYKKIRKINTYIICKKILILHVFLDYTDRKSVV